VIEAVKELTGGKGVDHAIEAIGLTETIEMAFNMLAKGGSATVLGVPKPDAKITLPAMPLMRELGIRGSNMGGVRTTIDIPYYVELYLKGRLKLDELISQRLPLGKINEAFDDLRRAEIARSVIVMQS
jgi:S-(hydroxymethyl)glutathione dehydrogenase/alcohol dehydrogenase